MTNKLQGISEEQQEFIVQSIRSFFPNVKIIAFGSRVHGTSKKYSDLDLCLDNSEALSLYQWSLLDEVFADSDLPFIIDISDASLLDDDFKKHVYNTGKELA